MIIIAYKYILNNIGERYDFILKADQTPMSYWIRVKGFADCSVYKAFETAFLVYENSPNIGLERLNYDTMSRQGIVGHLYSYLYQ